MKQLTARGVNTSVIRLAQIHSTRKLGLAPYVLAVARQKSMSALSAMEAIARRRRTLPMWYGSVAWHLRTQSRARFTTRSIRRACQ